MIIRIWLLVLQNMLTLSMRHLPSQGWYSNIMTDSSVMDLVLVLSDLDTSSVSHFVSTYFKIVFDLKTLSCSHRNWFGGRWWQSLTILHMTILHRNFFLTQDQKVRVHQKIKSLLIMILKNFYLARDQKARACLCSTIKYWH